MNSLDQALAEDHAAVQRSADPIQDALNEDIGSPQIANGDNPPKNAAAPNLGLSRGERFTTGLADMEHGLAQLAEHTPVVSTVVSGWRQLIQQGLKTAGFDNASELFNQSENGGLMDQKAAANFDGIVQKREQDYQAARSAAGQTGIDWWRLGGQAANPLNYLGAGGGAATVAGRIGQGALTGAAINAAQPDTQAGSYNNPDTPGSFWWDKAKTATTGAIVGGTVSGLVEAVAPALRAAIGFAKTALGKGAADTAAGEAVVNDALRAKGIDPNTVDLNVLAGMKQEAQHALEGGAEDISPEAIAARAKAESLPIPIRLMKGQATGDPMLYSTEQNLRGIQGVGEPLTQRLQEQNQGFIQNLDALGAKDAPDTVSASNMIAGKVQKFWGNLQDQKTQLYDAVKNSQGLSALVDGQAAAQEVRESLSSPQAFGAWRYIPKEMKGTLADIENGKMPMTVSTLQELDKLWGQDAAGATGSTASSTAHAINQARSILGKADISDDVGQDAMKAYAAAKQAHAAQMGLLESKLLNVMPNPHFQPLVKSVVQDGKLDDVFSKGFMGASPSDVAKNMDFLGQIDPDSKSLVSNALIGEIKRQALSSASDERGTVSQSVLTGWARDPVKSSRLEKLLAPAQYDTFQNLADTVETAKRFPVASTVNTSNSGSAVVNAMGSMLKRSAAAQITKRMPLVGGIAEAFGEGTKQAAAETGVQSALNPGVTLRSLLSNTPKQAATNRLLSRLVVPGAVAATQPNKAPPE